MKREDLKKQRKDAEEMLKLFQQLEYGDKREVKGIMTGIILKQPRQEPTVVAV